MGVARITESSFSTLETAWFAMARPRTCPHCRAVLGSDGGEYDADGSLLCDACRKPVLPTTWESEALVDASLRPPATPYKPNQATVEGPYYKTYPPNNYQPPARNVAPPPTPWMGASAEPGATWDT